MASRTHSTDPLDQAQLAGFAARRRERSRLEVEDLLEALDWGLRHPATEPEPYAGAPTAQAARAAQRVVNAGWLAEKDERLRVHEQAANDVIEDPWVPPVDWSAFAPLAAAWGRSTTAGKLLVTDALILAYRLPRLFEAVKAGEVQVWRARRIATAVRMRPVDVAEHIDAIVTPIADSIGATRLEALIDEAMLTLHAEERELDLEAARESYGIELTESFHGFHDTETTPVAALRICGDIVDLTAFEATAATLARILGEQQRSEGVTCEPLEVRKARAVGILADPHLACELLNGTPLTDLRTSHGMQLVIHLNADALTGGDPIANLEGPLRARLGEQVAQWCARPEAAFTVLPVIDLTQHTASTSQTVTATMATRAKLRTPTCVFPYCDRPSRTCDIDHRIPTGDQPGQHGTTCDCNLVPLCRHHHRLKTHAGWTYTPIETNVWLWTDPHHRSYLRDHHSTRDVTADPESVPNASTDWAERRDQLRRQRIPTKAPTKTGCREPQDPWSTTHHPDHDPPPF